MSKISHSDYFHYVASCRNFKQKHDVLNSWCVGINNFSRIAEGQHNKRNILSPKAFLEFLAWIFTLGHVDFSESRNEAGRKMMGNIKSSSYLKKDDGSEIMRFYMNNPEGWEDDIRPVILEVRLTPPSVNGARQGRTAIIFDDVTESGKSIFRFEGTDFETKDESSLLLITNKVLACYQREINNEIALQLNNNQMNWQAQDYKDFFKDALATTLSTIKQEHLLIMPHVCNEIIPDLLGEEGILEEIDNLSASDDAFTNNKKSNDEINKIKVDLAHILIDSLDDAPVDLSPVIRSMLETFLQSPYMSDVKILEWCFNKSIEYFNAAAKIDYACDVIKNIKSGCDQSKRAEALFSLLDKEPYKNNPDLQTLIWDKLIVYVEVLNLSNQEKSHLIERLFNNAQSVFKDVPVSILVNKVFLNDFFMKKPEMIKWYLPQLLVSYAREKRELDSLECDINNRQLTKEQLGQLIEEKAINELNLRTNVLVIIKNLKSALLTDFNDAYLEGRKPPEWLQDAIQNYVSKQETDAE
ncbi:DNA-binding protein [Escherichia coli]|uniref:DNA-binding protein n=1 Tax=Escherichia coli TaxID=562 RepID=UPI001FF1DB26|nr:DNA-binding protein [Escherichia coli]